MILNLSYNYFPGVSVGVSCFTLVSISLERFFAICWPLHARKWQTLSHAYKMIGVCWFLASVVSLPIGVHTKYRKRSGYALCGEIWESVLLEQAYTVTLDLFLLVFPLLIMTTAYGCVVHTLWVGIQANQRDISKNIILKTFDKNYQQF